MDSDTLMRRSNPTPNADVDSFDVGATISAPALSLAFDSSGKVRLLATGGGSVAYNGVPAFVGIALNTPDVGSPALTRVAGFVPVVYGATVVVGDLLRIDPDTQRLVPFDVGAGDGHTHASAAAIVRRVVYLTDELGVAITGASPADFTTSLTWDDAGVLNSASETVTITEISGGRYFVDFTPTHAAHMYYLTISYESGGDKGICTPPEFQLDAPYFSTTPTPLALSLILGMAISDGGDGDPGVVLLRPQVF